ncbi:MAG: two-component sensor histidine kinase [Prevotellaceae bacterium]|jgi:signal transduction histidine kinase|nr:two-component sensor histidine kinase [Prevotellaceae bacterium]
MKLRYKQRLFLYFLVIFTIFSVGVIVIEQMEGRKSRVSALEEKLATLADMAAAMLTQQGSSPETLSHLLSVFPKDVRLTLLNAQGKVTYDNIVADLAGMENHAKRPEIARAKEKGRGVDIRSSSTNKLKYVYYAKRHGSSYIRLALPYNSAHVQQFLKTSNLFLYYTLAIFAVMLLLINLVAGRFGESIRQLRDFTLATESGKPATLSVDFPQDELGEIGAKIAENYEQLSQSKKAVAAEREKLLQHVHSSEEGLCFFSADKTVEFYNGLFIQYLDTITSEAGSNPAAVFTDAAFENVARFISAHAADENFFETQIARQGKHFTVHVNIFDDSTFEVVVNDITVQEKTRRLKQEMTGNIAHELRTPVTGIRGYLETILSQPLEAERQRYFVSKAYNQSLLLSDLIRDMSLITKMEEAPLSFHLEPVGVSKLLQDLKVDLEVQLQEKNMDMRWSVYDNVVVNGNRNLLYSIFRNLTDNAIRYAGADTTIYISKYNEDKNFYYFSYSDNGAGIPDEHHLNRLFERFYRVTEGRTRDSGGSGLGLSIVKNAILFHKGTIVAKNVLSGGLEFLFKLPKAEGSR